MRKHGWQLPYHPLQCSATDWLTDKRAAGGCDSRVLGTGVHLLVFFVPFVGTKPFQIVAMAIYTPLVYPYMPSIFEMKPN
ncbi:putative protein S-acyltransferase 22 [Zea mays]|uniref:Uncharacterized protein n=1 Tax=Zea mays TaxID=4577 RepID=A0A1D6I0B0_MAIZE|nr:putative protein S-acyltransferase 22 [Zea mays]